MIENPFIITEKVIPEYFCDREKESSELIKLVKNGNNVVLISRRRLGKTGLIQYCFGQDIIKDNFLTIYIDILSTTNLREFTYLLGREVFDSVRSKGEKIWKRFLTVVKSLSGKVGFDAMSGLPTLNLQLGDITEPEYTLKEVFNYISEAGRPCIVAIDEFQQIMHYPEKNVEALIRSHLLQINNCRMIFSGSEKDILAGMFVNTKRPFYQSAHFMELRPIPREVYSDFIVEMFGRGLRNITETIAKEIYDAFDGITYYIQRVCNGVYANVGQGGEVTGRVISHTIEEILYSFDTIFRVRLSQLTMRQKELLFALAQEGVYEKITSADFIHKYSLASSSAIQTSQKSLIKGGLIARTDAGYEVEDRFFRMWIERHY